MKKRNELTVRFTVAITPEEDAALRDIESHTPFKGVRVDRNTLMRYIILSYKEAVTKTPILMSDLNAMETRIITAFALGGGATQKKEKQAPMSYLDKKEEKERARRDEGIAICNELAGRVDGDICTFKTYEITAGGLVVDGIASERLSALPGLNWVEKQYDPSREAWEAAHREDQAKHK